MRPHLIVTFVVSGSALSAMNCCIGVLAGTAVSVEAVAFHGQRPSAGKDAGARCEAETPLLALTEVESAQPACSLLHGLEAKALTQACRHLVQAVALARLVQVDCELVEPCEEERRALGIGAP